MVMRSNRMHSQSSQSQESLPFGLLFSLAAAHKLRTGTISVPEDSLLHSLPSCNFFPLNQFIQTRTQSRETRTVALAYGDAGYAVDLPFSLHCCDGLACHPADSACGMRQLR